MHLFTKPCYLFVCKHQTYNCKEQKGMHLLSHQYHISNHVAAEVIKFYYSIPTSSSTRVVNTSSVTEVFLGFSCTGTLITGIGGGTGWGDITNWEAGIVMGATGCSTKVCGIYEKSVRASNSTFTKLAVSKKKDETNLLIKGTVQVFIKQK